MKREEIQSFEDLKTFISQEKTGSVCHYTSYESLVMILKNRSFRLSRFDLMNDYAEKELSKCINGDSRFIMSFAHSTESVAMWALYGKNSSLRLRLEFPVNRLLDSVDSNFYFDSQQVKKIPLFKTLPIFSEYSKKGFTYSDVVYYDRKKHAFRLGGSPIKSITVSDEMINELAGTIKYNAWEYERESRLSVIIHHEVDTKNNSKEELKYIFAGLTDDFIKTLTVRFSPWIPDDVQKVLELSLDSLAGFPLKYKKSILQGEVSPM